MLTRGKVLGFEYNRMVVQFTMMDGCTDVPCAISTDALDRLDQGGDHLGSPPFADVGHALNQSHGNEDFRVKLSDLRSDWRPTREHPILNRKSEI